MRATLNISNLKRVLLPMPLLLATTTALAVALKVEVQCVLVEKAQIARTSLAKEGAFGRANYGHQIANGTSAVLAIRIFDDPDGGPDSESFTKATLELKPPLVIPAGSDLSVDVMRSHYSKGASAWVTQGGYAWAKNPFSHVRFRRDINGLRVRLEGDFEAVSRSNSSRRQSEAIRVDLECPVRKQAVSELSSWIGWVGTNRASFYLMKDIVPLK